MTTGIADKTKQPDEKVQGKTPVPETRVAGVEEHTKGESPKMYTQEELDARLGKSGGKMKAQLEFVTRERDDFRTKHEMATRAYGELSSQITGAKEEIETLKSTLEGLESQDATKVRQTIRDWEKKLANLTEREKNLSPREERVNTFERTELIYAVADEYGLDDAGAKDRFKAAADRLKIQDRDGLITLAETMELNKRDEEEPEKPIKAPVPFSGKSVGGSQGKTPTLDEFRSVSASEAKKKVDSGEWVLPHGIKL